MLLLLRLKLRTYAYVEEKSIINVGGKWCFITNFNMLKKLVLLFAWKNTDIKDDSEFQPYRTSIQPHINLCCLRKCPISSYHNQFEKLWKNMVLKTYVFWILYIHNLL